MNFLMMRFLIIAIVVAGLLVAGFVVAMILKRAGRLGDAKKLVAPILREATRNRGKWAGVAADVALDRIERRRDGRRSDR